MNWYLKSYSYYEDQYDLQTIKECLWWYWHLKDDFEKHRKDKQFKKHSKKRFDEDVHKATSYTLNVIKIQRFRHKADKIKEWMDRDREIQERFDDTTPPDKVFCKECDSPTKVISKDFLHAYDEDSQVLFMLECVKCKKRQALYEDGTEWKYQSPKCPKCKTSLNCKSKHIKKTLTTIYTCPNCSYKEKDVHDFEKSDVEWKKREARDKKLLETYRKDFCLSEEEGKKAVVNLDNISRLVEEMKEKKKKEKDPVYQKAMKLKTLKVTQLKSLIEESIKELGYEDLAFDKPEIDRYIIISFSVNDTRDDRSEYESESDLKKVIKKTLETTNWRLMSDEVHYRLGVLTGKLKAYEQEDDLLKLVKRSSK